MNRPLLCTIVSMCALGLAACASTQGGAGYGAAPAGPQSSQEMFERDAAYMAYVERTARMRGIDVRWVNPPIKRVARNGDSEAQ